MASLDPRTLAELRALQSEGAPNFLAELIDLYLLESAKHLERMRSAFDAKNAPDLTQEAHTMKGMSGNLGAMSLSKLFSELQVVARAADWTKAAALVPKLEAEHLAAVEELRAERNR